MSLLKHGNKSDRIDARKLADLLRSNQLKPVYHGEHGVRTMKELVRSYLTISKDVARVMTRVKAIKYLQLGHTLAPAKQVYAPHHRAEWLAKISEPGVHRRAEFYYQQLEELRYKRQQVRRELLGDSQKQPAWKLLCQIPSIRSDPGSGIDPESTDPTSLPHQAAVVEPSAVLASRTHSSADYRSVEGQLRRAKSRYRFADSTPIHNHDLKNIFKGAAIVAASKPGPFRSSTRHCWPRSGRIWHV